MSSAKVDAPPDIDQRNVGFVTQFLALSKKNYILLWRSPVTLFAVLFSNIIWILIGWGASNAAGGEPTPDQLPIFDECGGIDPFANVQVSTSWWDQESQKSIYWPTNPTNDIYGPQNLHSPLMQQGLIPMIFLFGPLTVVMIALGFIQYESKAKLLGTLRALGMNEAAYWSSWWCTFGVMILINSFITAGIAKAVPLHVFQASGFGSIFMAYWFFQLTLLSFMFMLAAMCSFNDGLVGFMGFMVFASSLLVVIMLSIPMLTVNTSGYIGNAFWQFKSTTQCSSYNYYLYRNTTSYEWGCDGSAPDCVVGASACSGTTPTTAPTPRPTVQPTAFPTVQDANTPFPTVYPTRTPTLGPVDGGCQNPIVMNEFKQMSTSKEQRPVSSEAYSGCFYVSSGYDNWWNAYTPAGVVAFVFIFMVPSYHFGRLFSIMLGSTQFPNKEFPSSVWTSPSEELIERSLNSTVTVNDASTSNGDFFLPNNPYIKVSSALSLPYYTTGTQSNCPSTMTFGGDEWPVCSTNCKYMNDGPITRAPSFNATLGWMLLLMVIYSLFTWYFAKIVKTRNGVALPFYFLCLPSYWTGKYQPAAVKSEDGTSATKSMINAQSESSKQNNVIVKNLRKFFGSFEAVCGVNLEMASSSLFCLLGHNGAGKSTVIKMLTGEHTIEYGDAFVLGRSARTEVEAIRKLIGVCHQDDFLYDNLSAYEHLELFGKLRGVPSSKLAEVINEWLDDVNLNIVRDNRTQSYSGGMKRRLSLALATIGDTKVVVLDEPTTGMDPVNRRYVWTHVEKIKKGRIVLLTTHAMEEADLLADHIAIMHGGKVVCDGTPIELKRRFGTALQFDVNTKPENVDQVAGEIGKFFEDAPIDTFKIESMVSGKITVSLRRELMEQIMDDEAPDSSVSKGFAEFLRYVQSTDNLVEEYGISNASLDEVFLAVTHENEDSREVTPNSLQHVDVCCPCCGSSCITCCLSGGCACCCCPQEIVDEPDTVDSNTGEKLSQDEVAVAINVTAAEKMGDLVDFKPSLNFKSQVSGIMIKLFQSQWSGRESIAAWVMYPITCFVLIGVVSSFYYNPGNQRVTNTVSFILFGMLTLPLFVLAVVDDKKLGVWMMIRSQGMLGRNFLFAYSSYMFVVQFLYTFVLFSIPFAAVYFRFPVCDIQSSSNYGCQYGVDISYLYNSSDTGVARMGLQAGTYGQMFGVIFMFTLMVISWALFFVPCFGKQTIAAIIMVIIMVIIIAIAFPITIGLVGYPNYDELNDIWNGAVVPEDDAGDCATFTRDCYVALQQKTSTILSSSNISMLLDCEAAKVAQTCFNPVLAMLPPYGAVMTLATQFATGSEYAVARGYQPLSEVPNVMSERFRAYYGYWSLGTILSLVLAYAWFTLFEFTPPLLERALDRIRCNPMDWCTGSTKKKLAEAANAPRKEDVKVVEERNAVEEALKTFQGGGEAPPVLMHDFVKMYPARGGQPPKLAVDHLYLHAPKGETLALLGPNGAGKTTALKILSCLHKKTDGVGMVAGHDIEKDTLAVYENLGNCPQFDVIWPTQSVQRHLEFYARLKGMDEKLVPRACELMAESVGIGGLAFRRKAGALSGGMRRRLSIAIALIGAPEVLLLDEPSTGLDPVTRHNIWDLIELFKNKDRSIVITTHMMQEADILCDRIAIMCNGQLKVIGSQQYLKNTFGDGYTLVVNAVDSDPDRIAQTMAFVRENISEDAILASVQGKIRRIQLPGAELDMFKVFKVLHSEEMTTKGWANQWLLNQSTLEDVFVNVVTSSGEMEARNGLTEEQEKANSAVLGGKSSQNIVGNDDKDAEAEPKEDAELAKEDAKEDAEPAKEDAKEDAEPAKEDAKEDAEPAKEEGGDNKGDDANAE